MSFEATGYHSCRCEGTKEELMERVPFLSRPSGQWLGQGYYLWMDSDYWALKWRKEGQEIAISKFDISLDKENLLDLVGSVSHQIYFNELLERFRSKLEKDSLKHRGRKITVSEIVYWLLEEREKPYFFPVFPFWATRAKDARKEIELKFVYHRSEYMPLIERHQICIYPNYKDQTLKFRGFVHPMTFTEEPLETAI